MPASRTLAGWILTLSLGALPLAAQQPAPAATVNQTVPARRAKFRIVNEEDKPLAGAVLMLRCDNELTVQRHATETDAAGRAEFPLPAEPEFKCELAVTRDGYVTIVRPLPDTTTVDTTEIKLRPGVEKLINQPVLCPVDVLSSTSLTRIPVDFYRSFAD